MRKQSLTPAVFGVSRRRLDRAITPHLTFPGVSVVPLTKGCVAIIDTVDVASVNARSWSLRRQEKRNTSYAQAMTSSRAPIMLHRFLWAQWGFPDTETVDHVNGDGLDCRRSNLRAATNGQNVMNRPVRADSKSGLKGVRRMTDGRSARPWTAEIKAHGVRYRLGYFATAEEAAMAYAEASGRLHGAFSRIT